MHVLWGGSQGSRIRWPRDCVLSSSQNLMTNAGHAKPDKQVERQIEMWASDKMSSGLAKRRTTSFAENLFFLTPSKNLTSECGAAENPSEKDTARSRCGRPTTKYSGLVKRCKTSSVETPPVRRSTVAWGEIALQCGDSRRFRPFSKGRQMCDFEKRGSSLCSYENDLVRPAMQPCIGCRCAFGGVWVL